MAAACALLMSKQEASKQASKQASKMPKKSELTLWFPNDRMMTNDPGHTY